MPVSVKDLPEKYQKQVLEKMSGQATKKTRMKKDKAGTPKTAQLPEFRQGRANEAPARVEFHIPYPQTEAGRKHWNSEYGLNAYWAGKHFADRARDADFWHMLCFAEMNRHGIGTQLMTRPVVITFRWNDALDCSNHAAMAKMIEDAMKGRVIADDNRSHVVGICHYFHDGNFISVEVQEV